jgi:hypothetical protein
VTADLTPIRERVAEILALDPHPTFRDEQGDSYAHVGSTTVFLTAIEAFEAHPAVDVWAPVLQDVPLTPALYREVAESRFLFGRLAVERQGETGQVIFVHALLADHLSPPALFNALGAVASTADGLDEELQARHGGRRFADSA